MGFLMKGIVLFAVLAVASIAIIAEVTVFNYTIKLKVVHDNKELLEPFIKFFKRFKKKYKSDIEVKNRKINY